MYILHIYIKIVPGDITDISSLTNLQGTVFLSCNYSVRIYFFTLFVCYIPLIRKIRNITDFKKNVSLNNLYIFDIYKKGTQS